MINQSVLRTAEQHYVPYVLIVSMGLATIGMAIIAIWSAQPLT